MDVKFWGVRSDVPSSLSTEEMQSRVKQAVVFAHEAWKVNPDLPPDEVIASLPVHIKRLIGGETRCLEITAGTDRIIIDVGTGARRLGYDLMMRGVKGEFNVILTSTRWDHVQGWPFFVPVYIPGNSFTLFSSVSDLRERMERQQDFAFFPVGFQESPSTKTFAVLTETSQHIQSFQVQCFRALDAMSSDSLRITHSGRTLLLASAALIRKRPEIAEGASLILLQDVDTSAVDVYEATRHLAARVVFTDHAPALSDREASMQPFTSASELDQMEV